MNVQPGPNNYAPVNTQPIALPAAVQTGIENTENFVNGVKGSLTNSFNDFSKQTEVGAGATSQFLSSNTAVAKFAFLILVLIVFVFLIGLGISLVGYFTSPLSNPYLISGMIDGNSGVVIPQDPKQKNAVQVQRSNNENNGLEFTWSVWIFLNDIGNDPSKYQHIFNKGDNIANPVTNIANVNNAPGLYLSPGTNQLHIVMDSNSGSDTNNVIDISNIPIRKWVHVAIRMKNTMMDVYVNGTIAGRLVMNYLPKQNYNDVNVCQRGGFSGKLADLRYFSYALNVFDITNIVSWGPNTKTSSSSTNDKKALGNYSYLSNIWYNTKL